jgi:RNA polymerase sigma-70 factor (ECF subfamily)
VEDIRLNIRLYEGNPTAYEELFKQNFARMLGYCRLFIHDNAQANDLVQECFVKLWEKRQIIKTSQSVEGLLFVMLRNRCLNYLREQKLHAQDRNINLLEENDLQYLYQLDFTGEEEKSLEERLLESIHESVNKLPEKRKLVFIKAKIEGKKNKEVAEELGISVKAVEKYLHQAKEQIRLEMLEKFPLLSFLVAFLLK